MCFVKEDYLQSLLPNNFQKKLFYQYFLLGYTLKCVIYKENSLIHN